MCFHQAAFDLPRRNAFKPLERKKPPFEETPRTYERAHWVKPEIIVEVKFNEWTADGRLRQPIYLGTRDDKSAREVGRESQSMQKKTGRKKVAATKPASDSASKSKAGKRVNAARSLLERDTEPKPSRGHALPPGELVRRLEEIEESSGSGRLEIGSNTGIELTNLGKIFFPRKKLTKGDLMRYYVTVAPFVLPVMANRPLVLKRFPNGVKGEAFFQQNASATTPEVVRTAMIEAKGGSTNRRIVGGDLPTLLYTVQLGAISVDPWHSRLQSLDHADYTILDLDPGPGATFQRVMEVARLVREVMDGLGLHGHSRPRVRAAFISICRYPQTLPTKPLRSPRR